VDVLYVIDNSSSTYYLGNIKNSISNTVNKLSSDFDLRVIGTPLLETNTGNDNYQVMTNSSDLVGIPGDSRRVSTANGLNFFQTTPVSGVEKGLGRVISFVDYHKNGLLRNSAYLVIVLVSNGRDQEVEEQIHSNGETKVIDSVYAARLASFTNLKTSIPQLRLFSITANGESDCPSGFRTSRNSYVKMSQQLYQDSLASDSPAARDSYNICDSQGISYVFDSINSSIKQVVRPHEYRYWPITFAENNEMVSTDEIRVTKISTDGSGIPLTRGTDWTYVDKVTPQSVDTRVGPVPTPGPGEPVFGRHFIRFTNVVTYPDCVLVTSVSRTEYFDYVVLPQKPIVSSVSLRINGIVIPMSTTNGWSDETSVPKTLNIKAAYPTAADENPPVMRTGFMLKLNGTSKYYKSGDNVEVNFNPAPL
jgi:hypothetical protein